MNYRTNNALVQTFAVDNLNPVREEATVYGIRPWRAWRRNACGGQPLFSHGINQLTNISRSGTLTVSGVTSDPATNVVVNSAPATAVYSDNTFARTNVSFGTVYTSVAKDTNGRIATHFVFVTTPASSTNVYDLNGNLIYDGVKAFEYDDENQLTRITRTNNWKSEFTYDGKMRRRVRKEFVWSAGSGSWILSNEVRYVYDGNLVIQERNSWNLPQVSYTRGKDLSGGFEGAGGIGGLLARTDQSALNVRPSAAHAYYFADGKGNVTMLVNTQQIAMAKYQYDPFGNTLSLSGPLAEANLYRFSSKERHENSGLVYYLYRYYAPEMQRWVNRDPNAEDGGLNLHRFADNAPVDSWDAFGLKGCKCPKPIQSQWQTAATKTAPTFPFIGKATICTRARDLCYQLCEGVYGAGSVPGEPETEDYSEGQLEACKKDCKRDCDLNFGRCLIGKRKWPKPDKG